MISGTTPFTESTEVPITGPSGAEIRYTTNNTTPTASSSLYSAPITLTSGCVVQAIAIKNGVSSEVASKTFVKESSGEEGGGGFDPNGYNFGG